MLLLGAFFLKSILCRRFMLVRTVSTIPSRINKRIGCCLMVMRVWRKRYPLNGPFKINKKAGLVKRESILANSTPVLKQPLLPFYETSASGSVEPYFFLQ